MLLGGKPLSYKKHLTTAFGSYVQTHEEDKPQNDQKARTRGAISLGPTFDEQGSYKFLVLNTGEKITRRKWDEVPMPDMVID